MVPSINTIQQGLQVTREQARTVRGILDGSISPALVSDQVVSLYRQTYGQPDTYLVKLTAINEIIGGYGVEHAPAGRNAKSPAFDYVNMGDTYTTTIIRFGANRYRVIDWGTIVERGNYE